MQVARRPGTSNNWEELTEIIQARPRNRYDSIKKALKAIEDAHTAGLINDEESEELVKWVLSQFLAPIVSDFMANQWAKFPFSHSGFAHGPVSYRSFGRLTYDSPHYI